MLKVYKTAMHVSGLDLGKYRDYPVLVVVTMKQNVVKLVHVHRFPSKTPYASVIGYVKNLCGPLEEQTFTQESF